MFYFLYDCLQSIVLLLMLPRFFWQRIFYGKFKHCLASYLSFSIPPIGEKKRKRFLIYAVSMGETKAVQSLYQLLKSEHPEGEFYIASRTETGHAEAKKSLKGAQGYFLLPLDFSWSMKRFLQAVRPDVVIVVESDFWMNFLRISKQMGAQVFLVSGKMSERSFRRFRKMSFFARKLFSCFDLICTQNLLFRKHFIDLGVDPSKVISLGNLKFDAPFVPADVASLRQSFGIQDEDFVLVIASTHRGEEEAILKALEPIRKRRPCIKWIIVPRHPERFFEVEEVLRKNGLPFVLYSQMTPKTGVEKVVLVDAMGLLLSLYQMADVAIVGGSFIPPLKGHNILEPVHAGVPVIFGPYMSDQKDLVECVLSAKAGLQSSLAHLEVDLEVLLENRGLSQKISQAGKELTQQMRGSSSRTSTALCEKISESRKETFEIKSDVW